MSMEKEIGSIQIKVDFDQAPDKEINLFAYLFDEGGNLLQEAPLRGGSAELKVDLSRLRTARLFLAPESPSENKRLSVADMERVRAYEPLFKFDPKTRVYELRPIPQALWRWWLWCRCRVRGHVVRPVTIFGITIDRPVCDARVHICEVDRLLLLIPRLPDLIVFRLRDELVKLLTEPPVVRKPFLPDPPPDPRALGMFRQAADLDLPSIDARPIFQKLEVSPELNPQPEPPSPIYRRLAASTAISPKPEPPSALVSLNPQPLPPRVMFDQLSVTSQAGMLSESVNVVKETLLGNVSLILPYLCLWPWIWPYVCRCDELTTVQTDHTGRFDTEIWYPCLGDHPDLYFWVEYPVEGVWTTVYRPSVCCHTWWNYACGTDVTIRVTDPRVPGCQHAPDLPGLQVVVGAIGPGVSIAEIQHAAGPTQGLTTGGQPFAGSLEFRMDLSRSNLLAAGIKYYRWSYRRVTAGNGVTPVADTWHAMTRAVWRTYKVLGPGGTFQYPTAPMGPDVSYPLPDIIQIQPVAPPAGAIDWGPTWNEHVDLAYSYFDTGDLAEPGTAGSTPVPAAGKYEVKFELFDNLGNRVVWDNPAHPITLAVSTNAAPFVPPVGMTTAVAPLAQRYVDGGAWVGFHMFLHVDNNPCVATIHETWVDTTANAAGPCGFINFASDTSQARLSFRAYHPYGYARFRFRTVKGSSGYVEDACAPWPVPSAIGAYAPVGSGPVNGFARTAASVFWKDIAVSTLLTANGTACPAAAFGENLEVLNIATDGYQYAWWLNAEGLPMAFALAPTT